jgi:hypothetical protein
MIIYDDSSVISKQSSKLIDDARVVIYDRNMFIIQAIDCSCVTFVLIFLKITALLLKLLLVLAATK